jgi:DNA mismatch endonuclease, patch repair protein
VFPTRRKIIFVHGCFWHRHTCPLARQVPRTRLEYWGPKLARNVERDKAAVSALSTIGWDVLIVWECELRDLDATVMRLQHFLGAPGTRQ